MTSIVCCSLLLQAPQLHSPTPPRPHQRRACPPQRHWPCGHLCPLLHVPDKGLADKLGLELDDELVHLGSNPVPFGANLAPLSLNLIPLGTNAVPFGADLLTFLCVVPLNLFVLIGVVGDHLFFPSMNSFFLMSLWMV